MKMICNTNVIVKIVSTIGLLSGIAFHQSASFGTSWDVPTETITPENEKAFEINLEIHSQNAICGDTVLIVLSFPKKTAQGGSLMSGVSLKKAEETFFDGDLKNLDPRNLNAIFKGALRSSIKNKLIYKYFCLSEKLIDDTEVYLINDQGFLLYLIPLQNYTG